MALIDERFLETLEDGDMETVLSSYGIKFRSSGKNKIISCISPSHEDANPSMSVNTDTGAFHCHGCKVSGHGPLQFVRVKESLENDSQFKDAVERTAAILGQQVVYQKSDPARATQQEAIAYVQEQLKALGKPDDEALRKFVVERGIQRQDVTNFGLTYAPKGFGIKFDRKFTDTLESMGLYQYREKDGNKKAFGFFALNERLIFPITNHNGRVVAYAGRKLEKEAYGPKYKNTNNSEIFTKSEVLYGLDRVIATADGNKRVRSINVVEGYMDVIACHRAGITNVVASMGTALTENQIKLMRRYTDQVNFIFDPDSAGLDARDRAIENAAAFTDHMRFSFSTLPALDGVKLDPDEMIRKGMGDQLINVISNAKPFSQAASDYILQGVNISTPEDLVGQPSERATSLFERMPPSIIRETMAVYLSKNIGHQLGFDVAPEMLGLRLSNVADQLAYGLAGNSQIQNPTHNSEQPNVGLPTNRSSNQPLDPDAVHPQSKEVETPESQRPANIEIPAKNPVSNEANYIAVPKPDDATQLEICKVLDSEHGVVRAVSETAGTFQIAATDALEVPVQRTMESKFDTEIAKSGQQIFLINNKWVKEINAETINVVPDLSPFYEGKKSRNPSTTGPEAPQSDNSKSSSSGIARYLSDRMPAENDYVVKENENNGFDVGRVGAPVPNSTGDIPVHWLKNRGGLSLENKNGIRCLNVDRTTTAKNAVDYLGIQPGDTIVKIGARWYGGHIPQNASFDPAAKKNKEADRVNENSTNMSPSP